MYLQLLELMISYAIVYKIIKAPSLLRLTSLSKYMHFLDAGISIRM